MGFMRGRMIRVIRQHLSGTLQCCIFIQLRRHRQPQERQSYRSSGTLAQQKKNRKVGRPKLPKGEAKGRIVPVRFTRDDLRTIEMAAKARKQTVSELVRTGLL